MMKRPSFFNKIFSGFVVILAVFGAIILFSFLRTANRTSLNSLSDTLKDLAWTAATAIEEQGLIQNQPRLQQFASETGKRIGIRFTVISKTGVVLADSDEDPARMENHRFRQEVEAALNGGVGKSYRFSKSTQKKMMYVAVPLKAGGGGVIAVVRASMYAEIIDQLFKQLLRQVLLAGFAMILVAMVAAFLLTRQLSEPLQNIAETVGRMADGDMEARVRLQSSSREFDSLAAGFNEMVLRIGNLISELNHDREELQGIVSSMNEGLVLLDMEYRISTMNQSFLEMTGRTDIRGKPLWEIIREPDIFKLAEHPRRFEEPASMEVTFAGRNYLCGISPLKTRKETLLVFHDITELKRMEKIKREFVDNVSHELRTPLTAIKGFSETLLSEEKDPDKKHYLEIIQRHTDRLVGIVQDLLVLAELEEKKGESLRREKTDIKELVEKAALLFESRMKEKGLEFQFARDNSPIEAVIDPFKMEQVFINLMDNAVKYTDKGSIGVELRSSPEGLIMVFRDTGPGIEPADLPRIFERFYVADKSRSKQNSGTGLGLAIVKQIIGLHGGVIKVESKVGEGTRFIITLPLV
jgi:two-component system, OmpR family, phosphate regulon sensor histidine kinase PhoR